MPPPRVSPPTPVVETTPRWSRGHGLRGVVEGAPCGAALRAGCTPLGVDEMSRIPDRSITTPSSTVPKPGRCGRRRVSPGPARFRVRSPPQPTRRPSRHSAQRRPAAVDHRVVDLARLLVAGVARRYDSPRSRSRSCSIVRTPMTSSLAVDVSGPTSTFWLRLVTEPGTSPVRQVLGMREITFRRWPR